MIPRWLKTGISFLGINFSLKFPYSTGGALLDICSKEFQEIPKETNF